MPYFSFRRREHSAIESKSVPEVSLDRAHVYMSWKITVGTFVNDRPHAE